MKTRTIIPIFYVADVAAAERYYTEILQFTRVFRYGTYVGFRIGPCEIHLTDPGEARQVPGTGSAYLICEEVDEYFDTLEAAGARLKSTPEDRLYGMRDFAIFDLDGNQLTFGCDSDPA
ncbi:MAG TPA: VOC family protein [Pyrinomonadaceae bacterium]|nr:VOC family protein [Pyrinomonadaceae bacterium]